jgi:TctA family transporter
MERSLLQALTIARGDVRGLWASTPAAVMLAAAAVALVLPLGARVVAGRQQRVSES